MRYVFVVSCLLMVPSCGGPLTGAEESPKSSEAAIYALSGEFWEVGTTLCSGEEIIHFCGPPRCVISMEGSFSPDWEARSLLNTPVRFLSAVTEDHPLYDCLSAPGPVFTREAEFILLEAQVDGRLRRITLPVEPDEKWSDAVSRLLTATQWNTLAEAAAAVVKQPEQTVPEPLTAPAQNASDEPLAPVPLPRSIALGDTTTAAVIGGRFTTGQRAVRAKRRWGRRLRDVLAPGYPLVAHAEQLELPPGAPLVLVLGVFKTDAEASAWATSQTSPAALVVHANEVGSEPPRRVLQIRQTGPAQVFSPDSVYRRMERGCGEPLDLLCTHESGSVHILEPHDGDVFGWWVDTRCGDAAGYVRKIDTLQDLEVTQEGELVCVEQRVFGACDNSQYIEASGTDFVSALPTIAPTEYCSFDVPYIDGYL